MKWSLASWWKDAMSFEAFVSSAQSNAELWAAMYRLASVPLWAVNQAAALAPLRLLVIAEDWCGDAVNTVPVLAKLAAVAPGIELRVVRRDETPALMDRYLTGFSRSIPVVIVLDEELDELGWWGPRPRELQARVLDQRARGRDAAAVYAETRRWYARDRGETALREVLEVPVRAARPDSGRSESRG